MTSAEILKDFEFFHGFTQPQLELLAETARPTRYEPGERLFHEGAKASGCWLIESGHVYLDSTQRDHRPEVLESLGAGSLVGWSWLIPPYRWHFGCVADTPVAAYMLDTDRLKALMDQEPAVGYQFTRQACAVILQRLQATRQQTLRCRRELHEALDADQNQPPVPGSRSSGGDPPGD